MLVKRVNWLCVLLSVSVLTAANAAPTVSSYNSGVVSAVSPTSNARITSMPEVIQFVELSDSHLSQAAAGFLKPPPAFTSSPTPPVGAKSLPAVPGALLMGLTGFLCVSLVKDRRFWLAALTGLLWVGQNGIQTVPQLAMHFSHRNHIDQQFDAKLTYQYNLENSRLRSDVDGTQYIGLLHHLAGIPDGKMSLLLQNFSQNEDEFRAPQFAILGLSSRIITTTNCLAAKAEQSFYFSPAFIFDNLARGPPLLA
ncbi:MAG: hypothetical protein ACYSWZ_00185 [Planctomycetota bacterium]